MKKRFIQIGDYATADAGFTLCKWSLSPAVYRAVRETVPGMDGAADCSALLTGDVQYDVRTLTAVLELSEKTRDYRLGAIAHLINRFDGGTEQIILPDTPHLYLRGRIHVEQQYCDTAHAAVKLTAVCEPWQFARQETAYVLTNTAAAPCTVICGNVTHGISTAGSCQFDDIVFRHGSTVISHSGSGTLRITFREGWL